MSRSMLGPMFAELWEKAAAAFDDARGTVQLTEHEARIIAAGLHLAAMHAQGCDDAGGFSEWRHVKASGARTWHLFAFDGERAAASAHCDATLPPVSVRRFMDRPESIEPGDFLCDACHDDPPESAAADVQRATEMLRAAQKKKRGRPPGSKTRTRKPPAPERCLHAGCVEPATYKYEGAALCARHYDEVSQAALPLNDAQDDTPEGGAA